MPMTCRALALLGFIAVGLGACNAWQDRAEFAPPQSRWRPTESSPVSANAPPPAIPVQYCYRTLAVVDCYTETQPARVSGYTGQYPKPAE